MNDRYYSFSDYSKRRFGCKVYKLALDGGMTCPNRDGTIGYGGCIFCSAGGSGDFAEPVCDSVQKQIENAKKRVSFKIKNGKFIAYFQSYTNTYAPLPYLRNLFSSAIACDDIVALSVATRPDCLPEETVALLAELNAVKPVFVELGLQTSDENTAKLIRRGYSLPVFDDAVKRLKAVGINAVVHVIFGLPGESREVMLNTVRHAARAGADGIKLQLLHVLRGTPLADIYNRDEFRCLEKDEYIRILGDAVNLLPENVVVHRLTGDAPKKLLLAPLWSADKKSVLGAIERSFRERDVKQGSLAR